MQPDREFSIAFIYFKRRAIREARENAGRASIELHIATFLGRG